MNIKKILISICSCVIFTGCSKKNVTSQDNSVFDGMSSSSDKVQTDEPLTAKNIEDSSNISQESQEAETVIPEVKGSDVSGTYDIVSFDNGNGQAKTFNPGKENSILGSSSITLDTDGSCIFNLPGINGDDCKWTNNVITVSGAAFPYVTEGNKLTINPGGETYIFQKEE